MQTPIHKQLRAILADAGVSRECKRLAHEFGAMLVAVDEVAEGLDTPDTTRAKAVAFLTILAEKQIEHGPRFFDQAYLLNIVGEAVARVSYLAQPVIAFLRSALYFHGIGWVERNQRRNSLPYFSAHAELVMEMTSRRGLKQLVAKAAEKLAEERPFCLSNHYLAELKKCYWADRRGSHDACDQSVSLAEENGTLAAASSSPIDRDLAPMTGEDRVQVMLRVFARDLGDLGQKVYLLRHPIAQDQIARIEPDLAAQLAAMLDGDPAGCRGWREISTRLGLSEKVAKKEYLLALHDLLAGATREIYGDRLPSSFVRRVLQTLQTIIRERDLRIRENSGLGMTRLVERWEIALRFVLNHERLSSNPVGGEDLHFEGFAL